MIIYIVLGILALLGLLKYFYSYWERRGFPYIQPSIPVGNMAAMVNREASFGMTINNLYSATAEPFVGIYLFFRPAILIRDADLAKRILTLDFNHFYDRGIHSNEKTNPLSANLFALPGAKWKNLRTKMTSTFSSGRLKSMLPTLENVANAMLEYLNETIPEDGKVMELRELTTMYGNDVLASTFFGLDVNSFKNPKNAFLNLRNVIDQKSFLGALAATTTFLCPKLYDLLHLYKVQQSIGDAFTDLVRETIEYREKHNLTRKDFMQLLLQLRNKGKVDEEGDWSAESIEGVQKSMTIEQCAAQAFLFYIAGLDTTAMTTAYCLHELSQNKDVMEKALEDINETLKKHNGELTYECIKDMKYLELCVLETIRKYPSLPILNRECTKRYTIPGTDHIIEQGTPIVISLLGIQRDPDYFPDPMKFMPERFSEYQHNYVKNAYLPFGEGPRMCIGIRQGKVSAKVGLVKILTSFRVEAIEKKEVEFNNFSVVLVPKDGIFVRLSRIESKNP